MSKSVILTTLRRVFSAQFRHSSDSTEPFVGLAVDMINLLSFLKEKLFIHYLRMKLFRRCKNAQDLKTRFSYFFPETNNGSGIFCRKRKLSSPESARHPMMVFQNGECMFLL